MDETTGKLDELFDLIEKTTRLLDEKLKDREISEYEYNELKSFDFEIDDAQDYTEQFKEYFSQRKPVKCSELLLKIFDVHKSSFRKAVLLSECFPDPLGFKYTQEIHDFSIYIIERAFKLSLKNEYPVELRRELKQLYLALSFFNHNNLRNTEKLNSCEFMNYSLSEQIRMICIFLQDQNRLEQNLKEKELKKQEFYTGMESAVSNRNADDSPDVLVSFEDNFEGLVEAFDILTRYLYFKKNKDYKRKTLSEHGNITHIGIPSLELITHLAVQRNLLETTWEKFKYSQWQVTIEKNNDQNVYVFIPKYKEEYKEHIIASNRRQYSLLLDMFKSYDIRDLSKKEDDIYSSLASHINKEDIRTLFTLEMNDYHKTVETYRPMINAYISNMHPYYLEISINGMKVEDLLKAFEFFHVLAESYKQSIYKNFDQKNNEWYKYLCPIVPIEYFEEAYARYYGFTQEYSRKVISNFIFSQGIKGESDIFSRPLIAVNSNMVILCPVLLQQMNIDRIIESLISNFNVDIAKIGTDFEERIKFILSLAKGISVNTSKIEFLAFDDRNVEFDFLGTFEDYLLIWEFKAMTIPYSDKRHMECKKTIMEGVEQIERRIKVIKNDWVKIKELANIELPDEPYSNDKIIKLVGTNIFDFTTLTYDDIRIVDESTLLKFFVSPEIKVMSISDKKVLDMKKIWGNSIPNVKEFLEYLKNPVTTAPYNECVVPSIKPFAVFEGDYPYAIIDQVLIKNPYEEVIKEAFEQKKNKASIQKKYNSPSKKKRKKALKKKHKKK